MTTLLELGRQTRAWANRAALGLLAGLALAGCKPASPETEPWPAGVVARVGNHAVSRKDLEEAWARRGPGVTRETLLEELVRQAELAEKARRQGLDHDPALLAAWDKLLANAVLERGLAVAMPAPPSKTQVEAWYHEHPEEFLLPEQVRPAVIFLGVNPKATPEKRAEARLRAEGLLAEVSTGDEAVFARLAQAHSEHQASRYIGGDAGWISRRTEAGRLPLEVVEAAFAATGKETPPTLVETPAGFYIVRLLERRAAHRRPLKDVTEGIRYRLAQSGEREGQEKFYAALKAELRPEVNRAALAAVSPPAQFAANRLPKMP